MNKNGRPKKEFSINQLVKLAEIDLSLDELAAFFECSKSTIQRRLKEPDYAEAFERGKSVGNISLKRTMWRKAMDGNVTMLIWLSKNRLGFSGKQEFKSPGSLGQPTVTILIQNEDGSVENINKDKTDDKKTVKH